MNKRLGVAAVLGVLAVAVYLLVFGSRHSANEPLPSTASETSAQPSTKSLLPATTAEKNISTVPASPKDNQKNLPMPPTTLAPVAAISLAITPVLIPVAPEFTNLPPATVMENMRTVFRSYQSMFRDNPVGTNPEITQALDGGNRKQAHFLNEADGQRINGRGELIDSWGTPYFFHQLSGTEMEIHSAGPDRIMWTPDDLVVK